jgi:hypothetical protein
MPEEEKPASGLRVADVECVRCRKIFKQIAVSSPLKETLAGICPDCRQPEKTFRPR